MIQNSKRLARRDAAAAAALTAQELGADVSPALLCAAEVLRKRVVSETNVPKLD